MSNWLSEHPWVLIALVTHLLVLGTVAYLILLERKVASWVQDRIGPNRVGPMGLFQPIADGLKFVLKEDYRPKGVDRWLFSLAPAIMMIVAVISIAVLPLGGVRQVSKEIALGGQFTPKMVAAANQPNTAEHARLVDAAKQELPIGGSLVGDVKAAAKEKQVFATFTYRYPFQIAKLNIGVLYILAVLSLGVYGVVLGGWASNNKYSFLGGLRATAQMISYEIPLGLCVLCIVLMFGTLDLGEIVAKQSHYWGIGGLNFIPAWNVFTQPLTFIMFLVCIHAEANRSPFDLAEAEQELVGGYHTEYSSMRFALFFLAEYAGMITTSAVCVALFFGGWHFPGLGGLVDPADPSVTTSLGVCLLRAAVYFVKTVVIIFIFMWVRWSLPRFRFDQLMMLAWRAMIPLSLALLMMTALVIYFFGPTGRAFMRVGGKMALALLIGNVAVLVAGMVVSRMLPPPPATNRRIRVAGSRFNPEPAPAEEYREDEQFEEESQEEESQPLAADTP